MALPRDSRNKEAQPKVDGDQGENLSGIAATDPNHHKVGAHQAKQRTRSTNHWNRWI